MSTDPFRMAFIGTGGIARRHVAAMQDLKSHGLDDFVVTAVCDNVEENVNRIADLAEESLGRRPAIYADYREMLDKESLDGADLCLPHGLHHGVSVDCLDAGVHVLCEKPLGITIKASRLMAEKADETGLVLSTAVPYRRLRGQRQARWILNESGLIGRPLSFFHHHARPPRPVDPSVPLRPAVVWRMDRLMSGGGMAMDSGFHYCDGMRHLLGEVDTIYAEARELSSGQPVPLSETREDAIFCVFTFKSGAVGTWSWSLASPGEPLQELTFYGSQGSLRDTTDSAYAVFHLFFEQGVVTRSDGATRTLAELKSAYCEALSDDELEHWYPRGLDDGFGFEIWEFIEAARGDRDGVEVDGWEGLRSLAVCEAIYESALTGQVVAVDDIVSGAKGTYQAPIDAHWGL